jgi:hypothetical protein
MRGVGHLPQLLKAGLEMILGTASQRLILVLSTFAILRIAEAGFAVLSLVVTDFFLGQELPQNDQRLPIWSDFYGSWIIAQTYYVSFGYIYFSAVAFLFSEFVFGGITTKRMLISANLGAFLTHSLAISIFVFSGKIGLYLWIVLVEVAVFNWLMAELLWKLRFVRGGAGR